MKTGRNDPCPCGSGKKYKHCCLNKQAVQPPPTELAWRRIRRELEGLPERMLRFVDELYGPEAIDEAWWEFMLWDEEEFFDPQTPHVPVFMPWFLHCWSPNPDDTEVADASLHEIAPAQAWLDRKGRQLAPVVRSYLQSCLEQPFSFYEVEHTEPGRGMALRDLLTGEQHEVYEATASQTLVRHDLIFGQLARADGVTMLEATCSVALPVGDKVPIIELRKQMRVAEPQPDPGNPYVDAHQVRQWELEVRELYLSLSERLLYPTPPTLVTSDGEAMEFHKLIYTIDSPQQAFDALKHLDARADDAEALETGVQRDPDGAVQRANIDMARPGQDRQADSVSLWGTIHIDGNRLTAEVNSLERAERVKGTIAEALGAHCTFRADEVQTVEQALAEARTQPAPPPQPSDDAESLAMLAEYLEKHYADWLDAPLPALAGCSPRETAASPDGREQVAAMLQEAEGHNVGLPAPMRKTIFDSIRRQLGLTA